MEFGWDPAKAEKVRSERGFGFDTAIRIFTGRTLEWEDARQDYGEKRMVAVGCFDDRFYTVVYTDRGDLRWIITAWLSNRKERAGWYE
jgi:uncharacterized DUF497 family protein